MTAPDSAGAAFNPVVHTQDHAPEPPEADDRDTTEADDGPDTGEDRADGVR